jgi:hypothetical protein
MRLAYVTGIAPKISWRTYYCCSITGLPHAQGFLCSGLRKSYSEWQQMTASQPLIEVPCRHAFANQFAYFCRKAVSAARTGIVSNWNDGWGITPRNGLIAAWSQAPSPLTDGSVTCGLSARAGSGSSGASPIALALN